MKKIIKRFTSLLAVSALVFSSTVFAEDVVPPKDDLKVTVAGHFKWISQFKDPIKSEQMDYDLFGVRIQKNFGDNFSAVIFPAFARTNVFIDTTKVTNNTLIFFAYEAYFNVKDIGWGVGLRVGLGETPWYIHEKYYYGYRYIDKPLTYKLIAPTASDLGVFVSRNFLENAIRLNIGYTSGEGWLNNDKDGVQTANASVAVFPFAKSGDALKDLSAAVNLRSTARTSSPSSYNFLVGYKYGSLLTMSFEYLNTYSSVYNNRITGTSLFAAYNFIGPMSVLVRYDYYDRYISSTLRTMENFILSGVSCMFFEKKLEAAATFDVTKPTAGGISSERVLLSTRIAI